MLEILNRVESALIVDRAGNLYAYLVDVIQNFRMYCVSQALCYCDKAYCFNIDMIHNLYFYGTEIRIFLENIVCSGRPRKYGTGLFVYQVTSLFSCNISFTLGNMSYEDETQLTNNNLSWIFLVSRSTQSCKI